MSRLVALIGDPVEHSYSPVMHNAAFAHIGIDVHYELWPTPAAMLPKRIAALRDSTVLGANVTLPHKMAVIPLLDALEDEAAQIGAVNTIYKNVDRIFSNVPPEALIGANTDAAALLEDLKDTGEIAFDNCSVVLLGASGAARAAAYALVSAGISQLVVANRRLERAEELLADVLIATTDELGYPTHGVSVPRLVALTLDDPDMTEYLANSTLLINATSLGWHADDTPLPNPAVGPGMLVYDMVYRPTRLLREAADRGARTLNGMGMLARQGALAFTRWTGRAAPLAIMRAAILTQ